VESLVLDRGAPLDGRLLGAGMVERVDPVGGPSRQLPPA
jgi:hypothetical protein